MRQFAPADLMAEAVDPGEFDELARKLHYESKCGTPGSLGNTGLLCQPEFMISRFEIHQSANGKKAAPHSLGDWSCWL
jgi:hypothetical protein